MITIIHLSDFHMNNHTLYDWENYLKDSMLEVILDKMEDPSHTIIVCTGDLIDKAGKDFGGVEQALDKFREKVIDVLIEKTGISLDHFIIIPGNHDINRSKDEDYENLGLISKFKDQGYWAVNDYASAILKGPERKSTKRCIEYKDFENKLYEGFSNVHTTFLGSTFKYEIDELKIGVAAYNSAWCAYDDNDYTNGLFLSEPQYNNSYNQIKDHDIRIALMHHPLDWLKIEKDTVGAMFYRNYNMLLAGHVHEGETTFENKMYGSLFSHIAPCFTNEIRSDSKGFANGFSILEYDYDCGHVICSYYSYKKKFGKYSLNTDYVEEGVKSFNLESQRDSSLQGIIDHAVKFIKKNQCPKFDERLIPQRAKAIKTVKDAFVTPPIIKQGAEESAPLCTINDIIANPEKVLLFGPHESGKSILLYRILGEYEDNYHQYDIVPVYIDFKTIGNQDIETIIKAFVDCNSNEVQQLLKSKALVLLLDNYLLTEEYRYNTNKIRDFAVKYGIKIIATSESSVPGIVPASFSSGSIIAFEYYFIDHFKAENIKQLMVKWTPADEALKRNSKIEKLVSNFCSYSLPCTAMSVSLYLWSTENADKEPINQAVLLDIYIEIMLEKLNPVDVYHNTFDYHNKTMLLSKLAYDLFDEKKTEMSYGAFIDWIDSYLKKSVGFTQFDATKLGDYFIQQKIIKREGNTISFAHSCFFYFFLAKRMLDDSAFYKKVVNDDYYEYDLVIGYYSGLKRNDKQLLEYLYTKFNKFFEPVQPIYNEIPVDLCFTQIRANSPKFVPQAERVSMAQIVKRKPDEKKAEQKLLEVCDKQLSKINDEFRSNAVLSPDRLIVLIGKVLRNLDGVEDINLKQDVYNAIIRNTIIYSIIYKDSLAIYANKHVGNLPPQFSNVHNVETFFRYIPFAFQWALNEQMGTTKLCSVFLNKLKLDYKNKVSDVEKYMSLGMLWDSASFKYEDQMKAFIKGVDKNAAMDYVYTKLLYNYYYRVKEGSREEEMYEELLIRLKLRKFKIGFMHKDQIRNSLKEAKAMKMAGLLR